MKKFLLCFILMICLALPTFCVEQDAKDNFEQICDNIEILIDNNQLSEACFLAYELTQRHPDRPEGYFLLGIARTHSGEYKAALKAYKDCIAVDNAYYKAYFNRGLVHTKLKKTRKAIHDYNVVLKNDPSPMVYINKGVTKFFAKDFKGAINCYNKVFKFYPEYEHMDQVYYNRANAYYNMGWQERAKADYKQAKKLNPKANYKPLCKIDKCKF